MVDFIRNSLNVILWVCHCRMPNSTKIHENSGSEKLPWWIFRHLKATAFGQSWVHSAGTAPQLDFGIEEGVMDGWWWMWVWREGGILVHFFINPSSFKQKHVRILMRQALQIGRFQDCSMKMTWNGFFDLATRHWYVATQELLQLLQGYDPVLARKEYLVRLPGGCWNFWRYHTRMDHMPLVMNLVHYPLHTFAHDIHASREKLYNLGWNSNSIYCKKKSDVFEASAPGPERYTKIQL